jgi:membrane protease subunit HflC
VPQVEKIHFGREQLGQEILKAARGPAAELGIEVLDLRFKRIRYRADVEAKVFDRMMSERKRIAEQFRSEGAGEAARINGERERELKVITSVAYREAQEIQGRADAEAANIYAAAYNRDPEFYRFVRSMEVLGKTMGQGTIMLLSTDGELLRYLDQAK